MSFEFKMKEKKVTRAVDEKIAEQLAKVHAASGNSALEVVVDWTAYQTMIGENTKALEEDNYNTEWVLDHAGQRTVSTLEAVVEICETDADYKDEIAELTQIKIVPKAEFGDAESTFSKEGSVVTVATGHRMSRNSSNFIGPFKDLF